MSERRQATLAEVAALAGVSVSTASNALNGSRIVSPALVERVRGAAVELGYRRNETARALRTGQRQAIGVVIPDVTNPFFAELVRAVEAAADEIGSSVLLCNSGFDAAREARYLARLASSADGVLLCSTDPAAAQVGELVDAGVAVVTCDEPIEVDGVGSVASDNAGGAAIAARHLVAQGGREFALISGPPTLITAREREQGFVSALAELGIELPESRRARVPYSLDGGREGIARLLAADPTIDAVLASTDLQAIGAVFESATLGRRVPDDLLVCGFDGIDWGARIRPAITTIRQDVAVIASAAVGMLVGVLRREREPERIRVPVRLLERESTARKRD